MCTFITFNYLIIYVCNCFLNYSYIYIKIDTQFIFLFSFLIKIMQIANAQTERMYIKILSLSKHTLFSV